jgi:hypothetical protein
MQELSDLKLLQPSLLNWHNQLLQDGACQLPSTCVYTRGYVISCSWCLGIRTQ